MSQPEARLDFIVIGAQKAGTTSLFEYLRTHPQLYLPPGKELPFFSYDDIYAQGWQAYAQWAFETAPPDSLWGKVTPSYMVGAVLQRNPDLVPPKPSPPERIIPERIAALFPDVKLVAILRDPIGRAISHYRMVAMRGEEHRALDAALREELSPAALERARSEPTDANSYIVRGEYGRILAGYLGLFRREQLFVTSSAELESQPAEVLRQLWGFLGVNQTHVVPNLHRRYRLGADRRRLKNLDFDRLRFAIARNRTARAVWRALPPARRRRIVQLYTEAGYRFELWNRRTAGAAEEPDEEVVAALREHYLPDASRLVALVGPISRLTVGSRSDYKAEPTGSACVPP